MSKKVRYIIFSLVLLIIMPINTYAGRGCCSWHGGVAGCTSRGRTICADGTLSPSCTCTPPTIYGCTDMNAKNYNSNANTNDGSCMYYTYGCTNPNAKNYNPNADKSDYSCIYYKKGCTDVNAKNYDETAEQDDGSCISYIVGCTDSTAKNYDANAEKDDGSCEYYIMGCTDKKALNYNPNAEKDDNSCKYEQKRDNPGIARKSARNVNNNEEINDNNIDDKKEESDDTGTGVPLLVLTGIGAGAYYEIKKKKTGKKGNTLSLFKKEEKKNIIDKILKK